MTDWRSHAQGEITAAANAIRKLAKKPDAELPNPAMMKSALTKHEHFSVVAEDVNLNGDMLSAGPMVIKGKVHGDVQCSNLELGSSAYIKGEVKTGDAIVHGHLEGSMFARHISLAPNSHISGEVICEKLHMQPEAFVGGRTSPSVRLNRQLLRELARIAREPQTTDSIEYDCLRPLMLDGLVVECGGIVLISIFGLLELDRQWLLHFGIKPSMLGKLKIEYLYASPLRRIRKILQSFNSALSVIGDDVTLSNGLMTRGDAYIYGDVMGDVGCKACFVGDASTIEGSVKASNVIVNGHVTGEIIADKVVLNTSARVDGYISYGTIESHGGAQYNNGSQKMPLLLDFAENRPAIRETAAAIQSCLGDDKAAA